MIIQPIECSLADLGIGVSTGPRSSGLHMSDIYGKLFQRLEPKRFDPSRPMDPLRLEVGLEFESLLEVQLKERLTNAGERPGEFTTEEGIIFSPDLIIYNGTTRLGEIKLTWMSCRELPLERIESGFPPKFDKWFVQMMAYCKHLDLREARLFGFFVCGEWDRSKGNPPQFRAWDIEFTKREIEENWRMLINFARQEKML